MAGEMTVIDVRMKKIWILLAAALTIAACTQEPAPTPAGQPSSDTASDAATVGVWMTADPILFEDATKATMSVGENGLTFLWDANDKAGVYTSADGFALFNLTGGAGTNSASFDGDGFTLTDQSTYYSFFPYNGNATDKTAIPLDYSAQTVSGDGDMVSPMARDYMWAEATSDGGNASFHFKHIGSFVRLQMSGLPAGKEVSDLQLIPMYSEIPETATFDITSQTITPDEVTLAREISTTGLTVPESGTATVWSVMAPQDFSADAFAAVATVDGQRYTGRVTGFDQKAGKAYRWNTPMKADADTPGHGLTPTAKEQVLSNVTAGQYSGIFWMGGDQYAVVDDKLKGGGVVFFTIPIDDTGAVGTVSMTVPSGTSGSTVTSRDNEDVVFTGDKLYVSSEKEQSIKAYSAADGSLIGTPFTIPADMSTSSITSNAGFEALTYNAATGKFWTTTELPLKKDGFLPQLHRLQSFDSSGNPDARYLYQMDVPSKTSSETSGARAYVYGIPALTALDDGRLIVLEREVFVPSGSNPLTVLSGTFSRMKLYVVDPAEGAGILRKTKLLEFTTSAMSLANYEGMCLGPVVGGKQSLVMIPDSQGGITVSSYTLTKEYIKVILLEGL